MADLNKLESAFLKAHKAGDTKAAGVLAAEIKRQRSAAPSQPQEPQWSDLPGNILPSAGRFVEGAVQSAYNLTPVGMAQKAYKELSAPVETVKGVYEGAKERYGGLDALKRTAITDPVGSTFELASLVAGGAGLARGKLSPSTIAKPTAPDFAAQQPWMVRKLLTNAAPKDVAAFKELGPDAMLLDASPSMTGLAQGTAVVPNASKNALAEALQARDAGRSTRLTGDTRNILGNAQDPADLMKHLDKMGQKIAAPHYKAAKENAPQLPPTAKELFDVQATNPAADMSLSSRKAYQSVFDEVDDALASSDPAQAASRLHDVRKNLDAKIVWNPEDFANLSSADKAQQAALKAARGHLDDILKNRLGFGKPDSIIAKSKNKVESVDFGYNSLEGGKTAMFPETFVEKSRKLDPTYVKEGMKARVYNAMGTQSNDLAALKKIVGGKGDFNGDKLAATFGPDKVSNLGKSIKREELFAQNSADILRNSQTAARQAGVEALRPVNLDVNSSATLTGLTSKGGAKTLNYLLSRTASKYSTNAAEALTKALTLKGAEAQKALESLAKKPDGRKLLNDFLMLTTAGGANSVNQVGR